jgi:hypothetical protein
MGDGEWSSGSERTLVRATDGTPRLWIDEAGSLRDALGPIRVYQSGPRPVVELSAEELAVFVGEWLVCAVERDGPVAYSDLDPELRELVYELTPSAIVVSDDDAIDLLLS